MRARTFLIVNAIAAMVWGIAFSAIGYLFGREFEAWVGRPHPHGAKLWWLVGGLVVAGLVVGGAHWLRTRRR